MFEPQWAMHGFKNFFNRNKKGWTQMVKLKVSELPPSKLGGIKGLKFEA
jgi:hypothetical protein